MKKKYLFVDPFAKETSGVTSYVFNALREFPVCEYEPEIFGIHDFENIFDFQQRLKKYVSSFEAEQIIIEAPETLSTTKLLDRNYRVHIRLHGSRELGKYIQKIKISSKVIYDELCEIKNAFFVSAPSCAALASSEFLYKEKFNANCYANPIKISGDSTKNRDIDILFLGRWQNLKGIYFLEKIASLVEGKLIVAAAHEVKNIPKKIEFFQIKNNGDREDLYKRAKLVLIPSLFETASQVGLEAASFNCKIVTWSHLGICEYLPREVIEAADPWNIDSIIKKLEFNLNDRQKEYDSKIYLDKINESFSVGIDSVFSGSMKMGKNFMPFHRNGEIDFEKIFNDKLLNYMNDKSIIRNRKLRKFVNSPMLFFRDALNKRLPPGGELDYQNRALKSATLVDENYAVADSIAEHEKNPTENFLKKSKIINDKNFLGVIGEADRIVIKEPVVKLRGWTVCLFYSDNQRDYAEVLGGRLAEFQDFSPLQQGRVNYAEFLDKKFTSTLELINKIDVKNKEKFAKIDFAIFINPDPVVIGAIRSCNENIKIVSILMRNHEIDLSQIDLLIDSTDAFLFFDNFKYPDLFSRNSRRCNVLSSYVNMNLYIRKIVQETGPKKIDYLIPVIGAKYNKEYLNFDINKFQGVVVLHDKNYLWEETNNFDDFIKSFSNKVETLLVTESVYMRYKTLCEGISRGEQSSKFFEYALKDGFLIHVS